MRPKDADGIASSVDPDQTASEGAVWSGSTLLRSSLIWIFTICQDLSENIGSLRQLHNTLTIPYLSIKSIYVIYITSASQPITTDKLISQIGPIHWNVKHGQINIFSSLEQALTWAF